MRFSDYRPKSFQVFTPFAAFAGFLALSLFLYGCPSSSNNPTAPAPVTIVEIVTATSTPTNTPGGYPGATWTATFTPSSTPTETFTSTWTPVTILVTPTFTFTATPTNSPTFTATSTPTATSTGTPTDTPNYTSTPTGTPTLTATGTATGTATPTGTNSATSTATGTPTDTPTDSPTLTMTSTPTGTPTSTPAIGPTYAAAVTFGSFATTGGTQSLCVSGSNIWVLGNSQMTEWAVAGLGPSATPVTTVSYSFGQPSQINVDPHTGNLYVGDRGNGTTGQVDVFDSSGNYLTSFGNSLFTVVNGGAGGVAVNSSGTTVYAVDGGNNQSYAWAITPGTPPTYTYLSTFGAGGGGSSRLHFDSSGNLWAAPGGNYILKYDYTGAFQQSVTLAGSTVNGDAAFDGSGNIFTVITYSPGYLDEFNPAGAAVTQFSGFTYPTALAFDSTFNNLYVTNGLGAVVDFQKQ